MILTDCSPKYLQKSCAFEKGISPALSSVLSAVLSAVVLTKVEALAKFSEPSFRMTNEKFSMTNFQFGLNALVAAPAALRL
jgi:hypothetical protein